MERDRPAVMPEAVGLMNYELLADDPIGDFSRAIYDEFVTGSGRPEPSSVVAHSFHPDPALHRAESRSWPQT
jgi:hypothetical protein